VSRQEIKYLSFGAIFLVTIFIVLTTIQVDSFLPLDSTVAQIAIFPLVVYLFGRLRIVSVRIPGWLILMSLLLGITGVAYSYYSPTHIGKSSILIARFENDNMQNVTRVFREAINNSLSAVGDLRSHSYYETINSSSSASQFLKEHPKIDLLVWGNQRWVNINIREEFSSTLKRYGFIQNFAGIESLRVVETVPTIGLSFKPRPATASFIAHLSLGIKAVNPKASDLERELALSYAASVPASWSSFIHRSFAWLKLGNLYLEKAIRQGNKNFDCATNAFQKGLSYFHQKNNLDLAAALLNNLGVAQYTQSVLTGDPKLRIQAVRTFRRAMKYLKLVKPSIENKKLKELVVSNILLMKSFRVKLKNKKPRRHVHGLVTNSRG
jgi:hypothetical protein